MSEQPKRRRGSAHQTTSAKIVRRLSQIQKNGIYMDAATDQENIMDEGAQKKLAALEAAGNLLDAQELRNQLTGHGVHGAIASIRSIFDEIDTDGSGVLEGNEIDALMKTLGLTPMQGRQAYKVMDQNGDKVIDFDEFHSWFKKMLFGLSDPNNVTNYMIEVEKMIMYVQRWVAAVRVNIEKLKNEIYETECKMDVVRPKLKVVERDLARRVKEREELKRQIERHTFLMKARDKNFLETIMPSKIRLKKLRHIDAFAQTGKVKKVIPQMARAKFHSPRKPSMPKPARTPMTSPVLTGRWMTGGPLPPPNRPMNFQPLSLSAR